MLKFLRRDPTAWVAFAEAGLVLLMSLHLFGVDSDRVPLIMAVVTAALGVVSGVLTKRTSLAVAIGLIKAVLALLVGYGLPISDTVSQAVIGFAVVALGLFNWTQTSPATVPGLREEPMAA